MDHNHYSIKIEGSDSSSKCLDLKAKNRKDAINEIADSITEMNACAFGAHCLDIVTGDYGLDKTNRVEYSLSTIFENGKLIYTKI